MAYLEAIGLVKRYGDVAALRGVDLRMDAGEFACLVGPSGCGKTTLLRAIAGLETPEAGRVRLAGRDLDGVPAHERPVGLVFQEGALFPHLPVFENVAFAMRVARRTSADVTSKVEELLDLVGLAEYGPRRPDALSGGEQQRVALARALAREPRLLLMDEPLASLDRARREELRREIRRLHDKTGVTTLFVTHDEEEALALSDTLHVMRAGAVVESGVPRDVYLRPRTAYAAAFLGAGNVLESSAARALGGPDTTGPLLLPRQALRVVPPKNGTASATVVEVRFLGAVERVLLDTPGGRLEADLPVHETVATGNEVSVIVDWSAARHLEE